VGEKPLFYFDNGSTSYEMSIHDNQWHVRWILRERGITLWGQKSETLLPSIPPKALFDEVKRLMLEVYQLFENEINCPLNFFNSRFGQSFMVLTYCRMFHTLQTGTVQSKKAGKQWAKEFLDPQWGNLIDQAWEERKGVRFGIKIGQRAKASYLQETLAFLNYVIGQADTLESP
jgi:hypothetical protein